ncbi:GNAT family N-acetyltransferase [uncultured Clostridium sp.]|uniref:GNAT family N-acetyltransferase n=1 Tax=uncultured Clostridium sp. TaxID=59620 RepID=UPI0025EE843F|nr:GNAT family N-acetyltransferase [uncultured Clostridium sp.]
MSNLKVELMKEENIEECVNIFINTFTKEPWFDIYDSREKVINFFNNYFKNNYFLGYVGSVEGKIVALSLGMKKPWIEGIEYYVDEFCVNYEDQGKGIGSEFLKEIEKDIKEK